MGVGRGYCGVVAFGVLSLKVIRFLMDWRLGEARLGLCLGD